MSLLDARIAQIEQAAQTRAVERCALTRTLNLDYLARIRRHEIHIDFCPRILAIIEIQQLAAIDHAHRNGGNLAGERKARDLARVDPCHEGIVQRHPGSRHARGARAAIGLDYIAVDRHRELTEGAQIRDGTQASPDKPLDFHGTSLAVGALTRTAAVRRRRQHRVFSRNPTCTARLAPARNAFLDRRRAQNARVTELHQARPERVAHDVARERHMAHLVRRTTTQAVDLHIVHDAPYRESVRC